MSGKPPNTDSRPIVHRIVTQKHKPKERNMFYHVTATEEQATALEASLTQLGIKYDKQLSPLHFDVSKRTVDSLNKIVRTNNEDYAHVCKVRQMERYKYEEIYDRCRLRQERIRDVTRKQHGTNYEVILDKDPLFKFLATVLLEIDGVHDRVNREASDYQRRKRLAEENKKKLLYLENHNKRYTSLMYADVRPGTSAAPLEAKPKDEGAINALDLLGGDEDGEDAVNIFEDEKKDTITIDETEFEAGEQDEDKSNTSKARKVLHNVLGRTFSSGETSGTESPGSNSDVGKCIDEDLKPPTLEREEVSGELFSSPGHHLPQFRRMPPSSQEPLTKRPRIIGGNGSYSIRHPLRSTRSANFISRFAVTDSSGVTVREQGDGRFTVADMNLNKVHSVNTISGLPVTLRPTSSTALPAEVRDRLIADGLKKHQNIEKPAVNRVFRKDYKNPPAPLPADDGTHVLCHLCDNRIMCTRLSNLTNHVRRHSAVKQYQCIQCSYQHNEQAKVRLHMANNHNDSTSMPLDNLTRDMQKIWSLLMEECFPGYLEQLRMTQPNAIGLDWDRANNRMRTDHSHVTGTTKLDGIHSCLECGEAISVDSHLKDMSMTEPLEKHLRKEHQELCIAQICEECGYANVEEWKVKWHISTRHEDKYADIRVKPGEPGEHMDIFLYKFFPSIEKVIGARNDPDEEKLKGAMGSSNEPNPVNGRPSCSGADNLICRGESTSSTSEQGFEAAVLKKSTPGDVKVDPSTLGEKEIICELCQKILIWENKNTLCTLLAHAKRHFQVKQFQCKYCPYASSESQHVKQHMLQRHEKTGWPKEHNNDFMQSWWLNVMRKCFPKLRDRIDKFKFKNAKTRGASLVKEEPEEKQARERTPPRHNYSTRRKAAMSQQ